MDEIQGFILRSHLESIDCCHMVEIFFAVDTDRQQSIDCCHVIGEIVAVDTKRR